ncbi:hypothetical protein [Mesorhizobium sp. M7A.F.Ca.MR.362.00.0.0]|uniref:hypothetical protein n=1 Tax=Mesorhizobium sp. M7A.F.Ca.MR.362.00.0.0 TaxID=2496779 RepID=UPI000FD4B939|nr:hypothetical protein [Mesorhizobium sp. M7A.F.Ca.MR.362.00.0.0]RUU80485.1 hypothetical protein EOC06_12080 [Mesorhizobium sp. M7A.F.Ca.MR.362.00.0.0]
MNKQEIMSALQAELNRQFDLGVMTTFVDADGRVMLGYPISHPAPRPVIDVETLADVVCLYNGGTYRTVCEALLLLAARCHREKWAFENTEAFDVLHRIGDDANKTVIAARGQA